MLILEAPAFAPYVDGYINEALRLYPPALAGIQRRTTPQEAIVDEA